MLYKNVFNKIISLENLFYAWNQFKLGKRSKSDVIQFEIELEKNIFNLHFELQNKTYNHGPYFGFIISDPKKRNIHKAIVRDRLIHHAIYNILYPIFEPTFISNSFSCRIGKGTHKGVMTIKEMLRKVSRNNTRHCYALKCDIRKFFDTIDQKILFAIIKRRIRDKDAIWLIERVIHSYTQKAALTRERERERERERDRRFAPKRNTNWKSYIPIVC